MSQLSELFNLKDRVAIITGGTGLLGSEFCQTLAEAGAAVTVADLDENAAIDLAASLSRNGHEALGIGTDVTSIDSVREMVESTRKTYGRIDILVNSAALDPKFESTSQHSHNGSLEDYPLELWQQALDVNLTGMFLCCQAVGRVLREQGKGSIINLCSTYGLAGPDQRIYERTGEPARFKPVFYSVTKAGVLGLTRYIATYYAKSDIRCNALSPGGIFNNHDEQFVKSYSYRTVMGRMAHKHEMNGAILFLASDASSYMTGANLVVDGGWTAW
jgi:2-deoxy-D-gluconate 3-dehydrogenase